MTLVYKGRVSSNHLRRNWSNPHSIETVFNTSTVEFEQFGESLTGHIVFFEVPGRFELGSTVNIEVTMMGEQLA